MHILHKARALPQPITARALPQRITARALGREQTADRNGSLKATRSSPAESCRPPIITECCARAAFALYWLYQVVNSNSTFISVAQIRSESESESEQKETDEVTSDEEAEDAREEAIKTKVRERSGAAVTELREDNGTGTGKRGAAS